MNLSHAGVALSLVMCAVALRQESRLDPATVKSVKTVPSSPKAKPFMVVGQKIVVPPLTDKEIEEMLSQSEKMGNVKTDGGSVSGTALSFYAGDLSPHGLPSWTSSAGVYYSCPTSVGPNSVWFTDAVGVHNVRGLGLHLTGVHAHLLVVEVLLTAEPGAEPGTRLEALVDDGPGPVQIIRPGRARVAIFVVAPDPATHDARLTVNVDPSVRCEIQRFTVRPVG